MRFCLAGGDPKKIYQIENGPNVLRQKENKKLHKKLIDKIILITVHKLNKKNYNETAFKKHTKKHDYFLPWARRVVSPDYASQPCKHHINYNVQIIY